jgi:hypothetical protein
MEKMHSPNQGVDQAPPIPPNSNPTILDLASRFFNSAPNEELFASIRDASTSKLEEFLDAYRQFASHGQLQAPPLDRSTLRPYLSTDPSSNTAAWLRGAFDMGLWELSEEDTVWKIVDEIKHRLLYCHSIAVDDPFGRIILLATTQGLHPSDIDRHKRQLLNFVNLLIHLRPLIERHVLCFVSDEAYLKDGAKRATPFWNLFYEFTRNATLVPPIDIMEFSARAPRDVVDLWEKHLASPGGRDLICEVLENAAQERISHSFRLEGPLGDRTCPYLPFKYDVQLLSAFDKHMRSSYLKDIPDRDNRLLTELVNVDLPGLSSLTPENVVAIRQGDAFEEWRTELKIGLERAANLDPGLANRDRAARAVVMETLKPAKEKLEKEFKDSTILRNARSSSTTLLTGSLGAAVGYLFDPSFGAFIGAFAGSLAQAVVEFAKKRSEGTTKHPPKVRGATLNHYVALLN